MDFRGGFTGLCYSADFVSLDNLLALAPTKKPRVVLVELVPTNKPEIIFNVAI